MRGYRFDFAKRVIAAAVLALYLSQATLPVWEGTLAARADVLPNVIAPLKHEVGMEETDKLVGGSRKSNVLFLIEATAAMSFTPKGVLPQVRKFNDWDWSSNENANWQLTKDDYDFTIYDINRMMADATFGMGAMPPAWSGRDLRPERNLYGRDLDNKNNFKKHSTLEEDMKVNSEDYYFPFVTADNPLTDGYSSQITALETHFTNAQDAWPDELKLTSLISGARYCSYNMASTPWYSVGYKSRVLRVPESGTPVIVPGNNSAGRKDITIFGDEQLAYEKAYKEHTATKRAYPYALVYKNPAWWASGPPEGTTVEPIDLVPNDSRMYQTKLVLWRLLSDRDLFENIRFGMATTFLSPANVEYPIKSGTHYGIARPRQDWNYIFKVAPFGSNLKTKNYFDKDGNAQIKAPDINHTAHGPKGSHGHTDIRPKDGFHRVRYENGVLNGATTGEIQVFVSVHGQYVPIWYNAVVHSNYMTRVSTAQEADGWYQGVIEGPDSSPSAGDNADRPMYKVMNRASLWLPITEHDHIWEKGGKSIDHVEKFKMWINGFADIRSAGTPDGQSETDNKESKTSGGLTGNDRNDRFHYYKEPEIGIAGIFALPQAIFPDPTKVHSTTGMPLELDRKYYYDKKWIWYSKKGQNINYRADYRRYSNELEMSGVARARFNSGSGEAAGSVLDFFSPIIDYDITGSASDTESYPSARTNQHRFVAIRDSSNSSCVKVEDLDDLSFPIRSTCEDNWLIVVASGAEPKVKSSAEYSYGAWEAVKNLYDSTNAAASGDNTLATGPRKAQYEQVTMITKKKNGSRALSKVDLEKPIRTLVIGIVADPEKLMEEDKTLKEDDPVITEVKRMRLNLIKMAVAGRGGDPSGYTVDNMDNAPYKPYFASNSTELLESFREALIAVNESDAIQPGKGTLVETPPSAGEDMPSTFSTSYRIVQGDQWVGSLTKYKVSDDIDGSSALIRDWEFGERLLERRGDGETPVSPRNLKYWDKTDKEFKSFNEGDATFAGLTGINSTLIGNFGGFLPDRALYWWLQGYDYSYSGDKAKFPRSSMLADFGNSGIVYADLPSPQASNKLPGYQKWADEMAAKAELKGTERLYAQTNDGILHVIVPSDGREESAILPPPTLLPSRLVSLKTHAKARNLWLNVQGGENSLGTRSNPAYTLDGPLQKRRFDLSSDGKGWKTLLVGTLGRGGNGLYTMDISEPANPKFLWYLENLGGSLAAMGAADSAPSHIDPSADPYKAFAKLGHNSPKPGLGITGTLADHTNFIALPGGSQSLYNPAVNGTEGAALIFIKPEDGAVIKAFDSDAVAKINAKVGSGKTGYAPYMGMMLSEPTLLRSQIPSLPCMTGHVFAADNRGSVFMVCLEDRKEDGAVETLPKDKWTIRTVATLQRNAEAAAQNDPGSVKNYAIPYGTAAVFDKDKIWLGGGTSNALVKISAGAPEGKIANDFQMIFGFRVPEDNKVTYVRDNFKELTDSAGTKLAPGDDHPGWYFKLRPSNQNDGEEYVSAKPVLLNGRMYIPTFREMEYVDTQSDANPCGVKRAVSGKARLYVLDIKTGEAARWVDGNGDLVKYITFNNAKITELAVRSTNRSYHVMISVDDLGTSDYKDVLEKQNQPKSRTWIARDGVGEAEELKPGRGGIRPETTIINYWLMK
ncbi:MAG: hypothetical protein LBS45_09575 [Synergistaceae bacterium]|nr:hypothetical protein [Synergistaceae bacterium]